MTIKEFADKYSLDYTTVYNAAKLISPLNMALWRREYDENELRKVMIQVAKRKYDKHISEVEKANGILLKLK